MLAAKKISSALSSTLISLIVNVVSLCTVTYGVVNSANAINPDKHNSDIPANILLARNPSSNLDSRVSSTLIDYQGRLWIGTWQGLMQIDQRTGAAVNSISLPNSTVTALLEDRRG